MAVSGDADSLEVVDRRRIVVMDPAAPGGNQPYHYAANLPPREGERHISQCAALSVEMALAAIAEGVRELKEREYAVAAAAVLMASGRVLPSLPEILASHPLIHTAEGEFFRKTVINACKVLKIPVAQIRERELQERANSAYGRKALPISRRISALGAVIGPPWTADHKAATLAALLTLQKR